jgi:transaldolase
MLAMVLAAEAAIDLPPLSYIDDEPSFRWAFNSDACAVEKSAEAMRKFAADTEQLKAMLIARMG